MPFFVSDFVDGLAERVFTDTRIVHQDIDLTEFLEGGCDEGIDLRRVADVGRHDEASAAGSADEGRRLFELGDGA